VSFPFPFAGAFPDFVWANLILAYGQAEGESNLGAAQDQLLLRILVGDKGPKAMPANQIVAFLFRWEPRHTSPVLINHKL